MPTVEERLAALETDNTAIKARVVTLETQVAAGAGETTRSFFQKRIDPILSALTPVLIGAATIWITVHIGGKADQAATSADAAAAQGVANSEKITYVEKQADSIGAKVDTGAVKIDEAKAAATMAAQKSDAAVGMIETTHAASIDAGKALKEDLKKEIAKPRPLSFPAAKPPE